MKYVTIVSGGMDSVTLAHMLHDQGHDQELVTFYYGQRHKREIEFAELAAKRLGVHQRTVILDIALPGSALTDINVAVPEGHYADETMKATVVPNRNMMMLAIAAARAIADKADGVATGVHAGDHPIYPDCRPEFIAAMTQVVRIANEGFCVPDFEIVAPFSTWSKADIAAHGEALGVPWAETWSCYQGRLRHCGKCGTCVERQEAFIVAGVDDPTLYENR